MAEEYIAAPRNLIYFIFFGSYRGKSFMLSL